MTQFQLLAPPRTESEINSDLDKVKEIIAEYKRRFTYQSFVLTEGQFKYSIQNLYNKGLLFDEGVGSIGTSPFEVMSITDFGIRFLSFIKAQ